MSSRSSLTRSTVRPEEGRKTEATFDGPDQRQARGLTPPPTRSTLAQLQKVVSLNAP